MSFVQGTNQMVAFLAWCAGYAQHYSWYIIYTKWPFVIVATIAGFLALNVRRHYPQDHQTKHPDYMTWPERVLNRLRRIPVRLTWRPIRSLGGALAGLSFSSGVVMVSVLLHAADPYWLPAGAEKASHIAAPHITAPSVSAPSHVPIVGGALQALANTITGALQQAVGGTNTALGGITNAGNAVIDMGIRIHAATIAGQVAFEFGVLWVLSTMLLAIICTIGLAGFIVRTTRKNSLQDRAIARQNSRIRYLEQRQDYLESVLRHHGLIAEEEADTQAYGDDGSGQDTWPDQAYGPGYDHQG